MTKLKFCAKNDLMNAPILLGFQEIKALCDTVEVVEPKTANPVELVIDGKVDYAIIDANEYAQKSRSLTILPELSISSSKECKFALLFFQQNMLNLKEIAAESFDSQYHKLAELVLQEFYEIEFEWKNATKESSVEKRLGNNAAIFLHEKAAIQSAWLSDQYIDLVEEWCDKTNLQFVHRLIVSKRDKPSENFRKLLLYSTDHGIRNLGNIAKSFADDIETDWIFLFELLSESFSYRSTEETWKSLRKYYEYLFYHAVISDIPEIHRVK